MTTVVFLHAFPFDTRMWQPQVEAVGRFVGASGGQATALNLPGFGDVELPGSPPSLDAVVDALIDRFPAGPAPVVVGVSLGGYVAMNLVRRHPAFVGGLVLCDTKATADSRQGVEARQRLAHLMDEHPDESGRILEHALLPGLLGATTRERRPEVLETVRGWLSEADPETVAWYQRAMAARPDSLGDLARYVGPAALIWGDEDTLSPWGEQQSMLEVMPQASVTRIAGAGHLANVEDPPAVTAALLAFLDGYGDVA